MINKGPVPFDLGVGGLVGVDGADYRPITLSLQLELGCDKMSHHYKISDSEFAVSQLAFVGCKKTDIKRIFFLHIV